MRIVDEVESTSEKLCDCRIPIKSKGKIFNKNAIRPCTMVLNVELLRSNVFIK